MTDVKVDERGFLRCGKDKLARVTPEGIEFLTRSRRSDAEKVTVSWDKLKAAVEKTLTSGEKPATLE